ncbi:hypothetical protein LINPERHAP2_LOCUS25877 [Linum perenne]
MLLIFQNKKKNVKVSTYAFLIGFTSYHSLKKLSSISELCQGLAETGNPSYYYLVHRFIRLLLNLLVSNATGELVFFATKIMKTILRNKMHDEYVADSFVLYVERYISGTFSLDSILSDLIISKSIV